MVSFNKSLLAAFLAASIQAAPAVPAEKRVDTTDATSLIDTVTSLFGDSVTSSLGGSDPLSCIANTLVGDVTDMNLALEALQVVLATGISGYKQDGTFETLESMILSMDQAAGGNGGFVPLALAQIGVALGSNASGAQQGLEIFAKYLKALITVTTDDLNTLPSPGPSATSNYFVDKMQREAQKNGFVLDFFTDETNEAADILIKDYNWICVSADGILTSAETLVSCIGATDALQPVASVLEDFVGLWCPTTSDYVGLTSGTSTGSTSSESA